MKRKFKKLKAYNYKTFGQARVRGYSYKQWQNSKRAKERWDKLSPEKKEYIISKLKEARLRNKESYSTISVPLTPEATRDINKIEFKVYGYEKTTEGTAAKLEGHFLYYGDKDEAELEAMKNELWQEVVREVGKNTKKTYKVSIGFISKEKIRALNTADKLEGKIAAIGIGNASGVVISQKETTLDKFR